MCPNSAPSNRIKFYEYDTEIDSFNEFDSCVNFYRIWLAVRPSLCIILLGETIGGWGSVGDGVIPQMACFQSFAVQRLELSTTKGFAEQIRVPVSDCYVQETDWGMPENSHHGNLGKRKQTGIYAVVAFHIRSGSFISIPAVGKVGAQ